MASGRRLGSEQGRAAGLPLAGETMDNAITTAAAEWHAAQDGPDMDWDGFTAWLEADPRHASAFDAVALLDDRIALNREAIAAQLPVEQPASKRWIWGGAGAAAIAAALALTIGLPQANPDRAWNAERIAHHRPRRWQPDHAGPAQPPDRSRRRRAGAEARGCRLFRRAAPRRPDAENRRRRL